MDVCQENDTKSENSENNEIQSTEETEIMHTCPDERKEKNHVCCLLNISDITLEQDEKANEFIIGTGWEEAVQGWGRTSPTACIWPRKKLKKARVGEGVDNCLLCVSLSQGSSEASPPSAGKLESGTLAQGGLEKDRGTLSQTQGQTPGPTTASKEISKICFPTYSQAEKKSLQIKEFIWCMEDWVAPETVKGKELRNPSRGLCRGASLSDTLTSKTLLVLPPLKTALSNSVDVPGKKNTNFSLQSEEKVLSVEKDECVACDFGLKTVDGKGEKRPFELARHLKVNKTLPFPPRETRTSLLAEPQPCCLPWSLLPEKNPVCTPDPKNLHFLTTLRLLQKHGVQNYKAKFKAREPRPPVNTPKRILTETKQENSSKTLDPKLFPKPLLPSLTVSRVVIPVSTHRFL
ncbi:PREDICTED: uncharacterized protein C16orf46 homolog [Condylura cristata]|uniref:uncharacterized protein C16orf46 homolog n=1 Tax=Condylura cristata TaxID=143302 RepID=UPI0003343B56|nr:PREDICTED: uncharacterized protein C16orf46 homolog [Condylura cristata]